jgi:hypothetical protein
MVIVLGILIYLIWNYSQNSAACDGGNLRRERNPHPDRRYYASTHAAVLIAPGAANWLVRYPNREPWR